MAVIELNKKEAVDYCGYDKKTIINVLTEIGMPTEEDEERILVEITPNRPDLFSIEGIKRAIDSYHMKPHMLPIPKEKKEYFVDVKESIKEVRPYLAAAVVENIEMNESLLKSLIQIQEKMHETIGRKRRKAAIGIHDLKNIVFPLEYKAVEKEEFVPLDFKEMAGIKRILTEHPKGKKYSHLLKDKYPLIYDKEGVISFPPIINSEKTRVSEKTTGVFIEVTGNCEKTTVQVLNILVLALAQRGGEIYSVGVGRKKYPELNEKKIKMCVEETNKLLGLDLDLTAIKKNLTKMGYGFDGGSVCIPPYRTDIISYVDIIEDVAIGYGYSKFEPEQPSLFTTAKVDMKREKIDNLMVGMGFMEIINFTLTNQKHTQDFEKKRARKTINSTSEEFSVLRNSLVPGILQTLARNKTKGFPQYFYEVGKIYDGKEKEVIGFGFTKNKVNIEEGLSFLERYMKEQKTEYEILQRDKQGFICGRSVDIIIKNKQKGIIGEINPKILRKYGVEYPVIVCEIEM
ncbi:phenylalanine--tRNA ligase subunit beta [Candidatus Micrarchaeota archaeon]|nr:phenylalanine--tRNA ligase subunit beta [Candidatus Micrarchaeota archaeon]